MCGGIYTHNVGHFPPPPARLGTTPSCAARTQAHARAHMHAHASCARTRAHMRSSAQAHRIAYGRARSRSKAFAGTILAGFATGLPACLKTDLMAYASRAWFSLLFARAGIAVSILRKPVSVRFRARLAYRMLDCSMISKAYAKSATFRDTEIARSMPDHSLIHTLACNAMY